MKTIRTISSILLSLIILLTAVMPAHAAILLESEYLLENSGNAWVIDSQDDATGDISLQFGNTLGESITFDTTNTRFDLSDDLRVGGNLETAGTTFTLDADNVGAGTNIDITANQGTDLDGALRYDSTANNWQLSNNGGTFAEIATVPIDLAVIQARRSTIFALNNTYTDITFDVTDVENLTTILEHDNVNTDQIDIKADGIYRISYDFSFDTPVLNNRDCDIYGRVRLNDTSVLNGSEGQTTSTERDFSEAELSQSFMASLTNGDFITLQLQYQLDACNALPNGIFTAYKMDGIKGDAGAQGLPGTVGLGTNENTFTLDQDDTGGNVSLVFGTTLAETVAWNSASSRFDLSDDLSVTGSISSDAGATISGATANINNNSNFATNLNTGTSTGAVTIGGGSGTVAVNSSSWDISTTGVASGLTGITSTGTIDLSGVSRFAIHQGAANPGTCTEGDQFYNTTDNLTYACTATNTWTAIGSGGGSSDFEAVYAADVGSNLNTTNSIFTITTGISDFVVNSNDWNVTATGDLDAATITSNGLLTGSLGTTISGAASSINANSNFATNLNTGTSTGAVSIGGGSGTVAINSTSWDISTAGAATGLTGITSTGTVDFSGATNIIVPHTNSAILTLDNDNAGVGANVDIVANQGSDLDGTLRYNATTNRWEINNNNAGFNDIHMANVFYTYDNTGAQAITAVAATLNFNAVTETITDSNYTFSDVNDTVTFNETGLYKVTVEVGTDDINTAGGARTVNQINVQEDPLGIAAFANIPGALTYCYHRETTSNACSVSFIRSFTATDIIRTQMTRIEGTTNLNTRLNASHILVERIR